MPMSTATPNTYSSTLDGCQVTNAEINWNRVTHTKPVLINCHEPQDFLQHSGCLRNLSCNDVREHILTRQEGTTVPENDSILVDTGKFTGRCPKDRYVVDNGQAHYNVNWGNINIPIKEETFDKVFECCAQRLWELEKVYVFDGFVGASKKSRRAVRIVTELAWHHHFVTNMFIRPTEAELADFKPDITIINSNAIFENWKEEGLRSETCVAIDLNRHIGVVTGTQYSGEMKKGVFSIMNYLLPLQGIMSMHCSATVGSKGDTAVFFGLSGTGKTTLSADTTRMLIGDDEHGWDEDGVFNLEGGCYAKMINLNPEKEPLIHGAIKKGAVLENVILDSEGRPDYDDGSKTENTRGSYPMEHIPNHEPSGRAGHPQNVIFLACDAYGVLPPVSKLTTEQALYHLVSGYTAKVAGTEQGITEPTATFSICFGGAFMPLPAEAYATLFRDKIEKHNVNVFLVNTGWAGGSYGIGKRMDINVTRKIVSSILNGSINEVTFSQPDQHFQLSFPTTLPGVDAHLLDPSRAWADRKAYIATCTRLSKLYKSNFAKFEEDDFMKNVAAYGPGGSALLRSPLVDLNMNYTSHPGCLRNATYDEARDEILARGEGSTVPENDAILVDTGKFTGRCPKDRYVVDAGAAHYNVNWGNINIAISEPTFDKVFECCAKRLWELEKVYVFDGFVGASKKSRRAVRIVTELAWHHHFVTNMFIRPTPEELADFKPDITIINSNAIFENWKEEGLRSETCVAIDLNRHIGVVTGTQYSGEMKKGVFSIMNYLLPLEGIMSMHCSATVGSAGDTAVFFGLSGTGKTTLSADTTRMLIGDDEHGWDEDGVFNLEGGCYAKMINLNPEKEPLIHGAIKKGAVLENVILDSEGRPDYDDGSKTENTRGSYPMWHIPNHEPSGRAGHPQNVIFLACDAYGVLPPVSKLTTEQALYHLVSGYTAKVAGTEQGITEPTATFSICFGGAFMPLPAEAYATLFRDKIRKHNVNVFLVNTGWSGGSYGIGKRMDINVTRKIVSSILDGSINEVTFSQPDIHFQLSFPTTLPGVDSKILDPSQAWADRTKYQHACAKLAGQYKANFLKFETDDFMKNIATFGPGGRALTARDHPKISLDFFKHPCCKRNMSYDNCRRDIKVLGEGSICEANNAILVDTGKFTGRCPKDRYVVDAGAAHYNVNWGNINIPIKEETFDKVFECCAQRLWNCDRVYMFDGFVGTSKKSRRAVRIVTELAWHHHFVTNMFIRPTPEELADFKPDITIINSNAIFENWKEEGLRSETCVAIDLNRHIGVVTGTQYSGEMKKGVFSIMNYLLPLEGIMSMHCSATVGSAGDTAVFFGLSGTGKTTLSADTTRMLIGDDEHGWDEDGVFNLEGGCYAKMINLNPEKEPLIHGAIKKGAVLENIVVDEEGFPDWDDGSKTENTRGSYPMWHIPNHEPSGRAGHPQNVIFLACDAYGVLPPVSKLTTEQGLYHLVSGYTAKVAGTEQGITEPTATFSICFGGAFMPLPAEAYATLFRDKIEKHIVNVWLVNTGWSGGAYGIGKRMDINVTRKIVSSILDGCIHDCKFSEPDKYFQLSFPTSISGVDPKILDPSQAWKDKNAFHMTCQKLAKQYKSNFAKFETDDFMKMIASFGPAGRALLGGTPKTPRFIMRDFLSHSGSLYNLDCEDTRHEILDNQEGQVVAANDAILVDTGKFTGRCPKDRYVVDHGAAHYNVNWGNINIPIKESTFDKVWHCCQERLWELEKVYVFDGFVGASKKSRRAVRIVTELAWHHHFVTNMFIRPTPRELAVFKPDITIINSNAIFENWKEEGLRSETCVAIDLNRHIGVVTGTQYSGEMKKGVFSIMNYLLPLEGIMSMHCSATVGSAGDTAVFFGLSGTGKTTLSADTTRMLIGDDEHGWDEDGVFNLEGGCYAKMINLNPEKEPLIHGAIKKGAVLENVILDSEGRPDYDDGSKTENTRGSYPMEHIPNHEPSGRAGHPQNVIFLACDAYGVLPPVSKLTTEQALYHLVSGYTAKVAGTEQGITEPTATFSICFGGAFMPLPAEAYATLFREKIEKHNVNVFLVNTGWSGGAYGIGKRMDINVTRQIVSSILDGSINDVTFSAPDKYFQLSFPTTLPGVDSKVLDPSLAWADKAAFKATAKKLAGQYKSNFVKFETDDFMKMVATYGPGGGALVRRTGGIILNDFMEHPGMLRNVDYDAVREIALERSEGTIVKNHDCLLVDTGKFSGRCPKDRYVVDAGAAHYNVNWGNINIPIKEETFDKVFECCQNRLWSLGKVFVFDGFVGASKKSRRAVRIVTELAWHHHFVTNMFIRPTPEELADFKPDITIINSNAIFENWKEEGLRSETCVAIDLNRHIGVVTGTQYSGEMKKGVFSIMNYLLPLEGIMSMHCSATVGSAGDTAVFFGLSGTGKTTLSADTTRMLIGDDEHGWDEDGVFNLEGGCYAKMINLNPEKEPLIHAAIRRNAVLENVVLDSLGYPDWDDGSKTENTRGSYPMEHIPNHEPSGRAGHPQNVIFLACDAYGVLPPVSKLTTEQALYHLVSGYTAKVAGTEQGITEPTATFSICFGGAFMPLPAEAYAALFRNKIKQHNVNVWLVNTGWSGGSYGIGKRMDIKVTRKIVSSILDGSINDVTFSRPDAYFQLSFPTTLPGVDSKVLDPTLAWKDLSAYQATAQKLAGLYKVNFLKFETDDFMKNIATFGPGGQALCSRPLPGISLCFFEHPCCKRNMSYHNCRRDIVARKEGSMCEENDAAMVDTGKFTGRCPKDRYIVDAGAAHYNVNWGNINIPIKEETFDKVFECCAKRLWGLDRVYVFDGFAGTNKRSRRAVRIVTELAWHHHFVTNMFVRPTPEELADFKPDITIINSNAIFENWKEEGLRSETCVAIDLNRHIGVVTGTQYSGEMKKGVFSIMNYLLPLEGIMSMHCSATVGSAGDTAVFFGLSGTGKTTLSADTTRMLIGDDEHGWDEDGVFNIEGGCYAKVINLDEDKEPLIHGAIKRGAVLENIVVDEDGLVDYADGSKTENTRCSYPMWHIPNHEPSGRAGHPQNVIFLACDAYGVLPPVSKLTTEQALYHLVSGYTAKVAGTEQGITEPTATFSICFGGAFMPLPASAYAALFREKISKHGSNVFLVNTGWTGGAYGIGKRMDINVTRQIVSSILDGSINDVTFSAPDQHFQLSFPTTLRGVDPKVLDPSQAWQDSAAFEETCNKLAGQYKSNFAQFETDDFMKILATFGPSGTALLKTESA